LNSQPHATEQRSAAQRSAAQRTEIALKGIEGKRLMYKIPH
jgi:hypothetical protein